MPIRLAPISGTPYVGGTQPGYLYVTGGLQTLTTQFNGSTVVVTGTMTCSALILTAHSQPFVATSPDGLDTWIGVEAGVYPHINTGGENVGLGYIPLNSLTTGTANVAIGGGAMLSTTTGNRNVGVGRHALWGNTIGSDNIAIGEFAMDGNVASFDMGDYNIAVGPGSLLINTGDENVAIGHSAARRNTSGSHCVGIGSFALDNNTTGTYNTAIGDACGIANTTGLGNTFLGVNAGYTDGTTATTATLQYATAIGAFAQVTANNSLILGGTGSYLVKVGVGVTAPAAGFHLISTTEQQRLGYDASNYLSTTVSSAGVATIASVGTADGIYFSTDGSNKFRILETGETQIVNNSVTGAVLTFGYLPDMANFKNAITNTMSGTPSGHLMAFTQTSGGVTTTALTFSADGKATFAYTPVFATNVGIRLGSDTPQATLDIRNATLSEGVTLALTYSSDYGHFLKTSFAGGSDVANIWHFYAQTGTADVQAEVLRLRGNQVAEVVKNLSVKGGSAVGTSGDGVIIVGTGTAPSTSPTDAWQCYSADIAAGNAAPHFRTENGDVIKLYKTGTYTPSNVSTDRSYDANATTVDELADVLGTLIADLQLLGIIG